MMGELPNFTSVFRIAVNGDLHWETGITCNEVPPVSVHPHECNLVRHPIVIFADEVPNDRHGLAAPEHIDRLVGVEAVVFAAAGVVSMATYIGRPALLAMK